MQGTLHQRQMGVRIILVSHLASRSGFVGVRVFLFRTGEIFLKKTVKSENFRLNVFYILQVLEKYSDEEHPLSVTEIRDRVNTEFGYLSATGLLMSNDTIKRILEELIACVFTEGKNGREWESEYGFYVCCVMRKGEKFVPYRAEEGAIAPKKYFYYESAFKEAELLVLKDAIETYSYFSEEDITEIVGKLVRLRPQSFPKQRYLDIARNERDEDSLLLMNIDMLNDIIQRRQGAVITYGAYDINKKLVPRPGYPKKVEPVHLLWSNGYYYLLAYNEKYKNTVSYRVDRITDIEETELEKSNRVDNFNSVQYRHEHPVMFGGEKKRMVLLCRDTGRNYIMNTIMDVFGKNAKVTKADRELVEKVLPESYETYEKQGISWLKVVIETTSGGVELWATQYCNDCVIVEPEESAKRVIQRLQNGIENYKRIE